MAFKNAVSKIREMHVAKTELIWNSQIGRNDISLFEKQYNDYLKETKNINPVMAMDVLRFPSRTFCKFPTVSLKRMFDNSLIIAKNKNLKLHIGIYNAVMCNYISNDVEFQMDEMIKDIDKNQLEYNHRTYRLMLKYYCETGQIAAAELLVEKFKKLRYSLEESEIGNFIYCYTLNRQLDKLKQFMTKNNVKKDDFFVLVAEAKAYTSLGDIDTSKCLLNKIKKFNYSSPALYGTLYRRLCQSGLSESYKNTFLDMVSSNLTVSDVCYLVYKLNRFELFTDALSITQKFNHLIQKNFDVQNIICSFNSPNCPSNIYKDVLLLLINRLKGLQNNLFFCLNFDEAVQFTLNDFAYDYVEIIFVSLFNKAINDKNVDSINKSMQIGYSMLRHSALNEILLLHIFPALLESGLVSNTIDILKLLSIHRKYLSPVILFFNFMKGNFTDLVNDNLENIKNLRLTGSTGIAKAIVNDTNLSEITKFFNESYKYFNTIMLDRILKKVIIERIISLAEIENMAGIQETLKLTEIYNVPLSSEDIFIIKKTKLKNNEEFMSFCNTICK